MINIKAQDRNSVEKSELQRNAIVGKLSLEKKLHEISESQEKVVELNYDKPVLKYRTQTSGSPLESYSTLHTPNIGNRLHPPRFVKVPTQVLRSEKPDRTFGNLLLPDEERYLNLTENNNPFYQRNDYSSALLSNSYFDVYNDTSNRNAGNDNLNLYQANHLALSYLPSPRTSSSGALAKPLSFDQQPNLYRRNMSSDKNVRFQQSSKNNGTLNMSARDVPSKPPHFTPSTHYTSNVCKSLNYQTWSSTIVPKPERPRPGSASRFGDNNKATNTLDSFLNQSNSMTMSRPYIGSSFPAKAPRPGSSTSNRVIRKETVETKSCPNVSATEKSFKPDSVHLSDHQVGKLGGSDLAISAQKPGTELLPLSARGTFTSKKPSTELTASQRSRIIRNKLKPGLHYNVEAVHTVAAVPSTHHVSSIPNQNSRLVLDESFAVLNSSSNSLEKPSNGKSKRTPFVLAPRHLEVYNEKDSSKVRKQARLLSLNAAHKPSHTSAKKTRVLGSARSRRGTNNPLEQNGSTASDVVTTTTNKLRQVSLGSARRRTGKNAQLVGEKSSNKNSLSPDLATFRKNSNDSGNGTLSAKSRRSCGDGADEPSAENELLSESVNKLENIKQWDLKRQPGDGEDVEQSKVPTSTDGFNYEDSDMDVENSLDEEGAQDECADEFFDGASCCQDSDMGTGEFGPCDDNDDFDCVDDSVINSLDEDYAGSEAAESECSGAGSHSLSDDHLTSSSKLGNMKSSVIKSIFSNCPPVINFATKSEQIEQLPFNTRKLLKWKMSPITPIVVRNTVMRSGFKASKKNHDWLGYFGKHMKSNGFRSIREYQKMNHFPGSFQLGRKDRLWRNISRMQTRFGKKEFGFVPQSYVLPWDKKLLKNAWEEGGSKQKYILKPPASARGIGIRVIHKWNQIPVKKPIMVQKYLARPYLINGNKFDLRLYVHVTSFDPLRIYLFDDGLVRFATCKYSSSMKHLSNKYMHLTNYSINKKSGDFQQNDDASVCQGHKWSLKALWGYLQQSGINTEKIWEQMKDIVIKTIISIEQFTNSLVKSNCRRRYCCHELFGFDIMLDDRLRPWLLEVNISPSLHSNSPLDVEIKGPMVKDMFNLCGFLLPDKKQIFANAPPLNNGNTVISAAASFSQDKRKQGQEVAADSKAKHTHFAQHFKLMDEQELISFLLDILTVNDIRMLVESEGEAARSGEFIRIFPSTNKKYLNYFEQPRYYNVLLYAWEARYKHQRAKGAALLESYCRKGLHLPQCVSDPTNIPQENVWSVAALNQLKVLPSPRTDTKPLPVVFRPSTLGLSPYSPPIATALIPSSGRFGSAKSRRGQANDNSPDNMMVTAKPLIPVSSVKMRTTNE